MKSVIALFFAATHIASAATTSPFAFYVHDTTGKLADVALTSNYSVGSVPVGGSSPTVLKMVNASQSNIRFIQAIVSLDATSVTSNPNFTVSGFFQYQTMPPATSLLYTVNFNPVRAGLVNGFLNISFQVQQNGCSFTNAANACPVNFLNVGTLAGTGADGQLKLTYLASDGSTVALQQSSSAAFPDTMMGSSIRRTFTISNPNVISVSVAPIALSSTDQTFVLDTSGVPLVLGAAKAATFTVTFAPRRPASENTSLIFGTSSYDLSGNGSSPIDLYVIEGSKQTRLQSNYQLPDTPAYGSSATVIRLVNQSSSRILLGDGLVSTSSESDSSAPYFSVIGLAKDLIAPKDFRDFTVNFIPTAPGKLLGVLKVSFQIQDNTCSTTPSSPGACISGRFQFSTLSGTATDSANLLLSYRDSNGHLVAMQPTTSAPFLFPNTNIGSSSKVNFTLTNPTSVNMVTPLITLSNLASHSPFTLDQSKIPPSISPGASADLAVSFSPDQAVLVQRADLNVGPNVYRLAGSGFGDETVISLKVTYTDPAVPRPPPDAVSPIRLALGSSGQSTLTFNVTNPAISQHAVTLPYISVVGKGVSVSNTPALPAVISPGTAISFSVTFTLPSDADPPVLSIGGRLFSFSVAPPPCSLSLDQALGSQQPNALRINFNSPTANETQGYVGIEFIPLNQNAPKDKAVGFLAGKNPLPFVISANSQTLTFDNRDYGSKFSTGTSAGDILFRVSIAGTRACEKLFTVPEASIQLTSTTAARNSANLTVITDGFDNTLKGGRIVYNFKDKSGTQIGSPLEFDAATQFHDLFFVTNTEIGGGMFRLLGSFQIYGQIAPLGSVTVSVANSLGQATSTATFQ